MKTYNPLDWYWKVAGSTTQVYSSASGGYVLVSDPTYAEWLSDGSTPTAIATEAELGDVLAPLNIRPAASTVLDAYQETQARELTLQTVAKILFNLVNEIRALKGQQQITAQQFRNYVKGLM